MTNSIGMICRFALVLVASSSLSACGGGSDDTPDAAAGNDHATFGGGPAGGTLIVLADREPDQLNPLTFNSNPAYQAVHLMFRALAQRDSTLSNYVPDLARSWTLDGDSVVLPLRNDVMWHDGKRVTADDVVFSIERQLDLATASPRRGDVAAVVSAVARDSFTVVVKLNRTGLYTVNALLEVVPVPRHLLGNVSAAELRNAPFGRNPVGNGFYRFVSWTAGQDIRLQVNTDKPDGRAAIDNVVMRFIPEISTALTELLTGAGDLIPKLPPSMKARADQSENAKVYNGPRVRPAWIAWNTRKPPLDDARVRRALLMAIDRETLVKSMFGDAGEAAYSPIPSALREHSANARAIPFDTAGAKRLLAEAGWRDSNGDGLIDRSGQPLRIEVDYISSDQTRKDMLVAMQSALRRIGVDLAPRAYESTTWVGRMRDGSFTGSFWGWGWGPGVVGPNAEMVFHSRSIPPNGPNFARYSNPRVDRLIDSTLVVTDTTRARAIWSELEQILIDDAAYAPIYLDPELFGVHSRLQNVKFRGIEYFEDIPYWFVDPAKRLSRDRAR
jgi:peptide/nickel transport system substrate-binding protein